MPAGGADLSRRAARGRAVASVRHGRGHGGWLRDSTPVLQAIVHRARSLTGHESRIHACNDRRGRRTRTCGSPRGLGVARFQRRGSTHAWEGWAGMVAQTSMPSRRRILRGERLAHTRTIDSGRSDEGLVASSVCPLALGQRCDRPCFFAADSRAQVFGQEQIECSPRGLARARGHRHCEPLDETARPRRAGRRQRDHPQPAPYSYAPRGPRPPHRGSCCAAAGSMTWPPPSRGPLGTVKVRATTWRRCPPHGGRPSTRHARTGHVRMYISGGGGGWNMGRRRQDRRRNPRRPVLHGHYRPRPRRPAHHGSAARSLPATDRPPTPQGGRAALRGELHDTCSRRAAAGPAAAA